MIIHVMGASGSGTSSLGEYLGRELGFDVIESDFYKWKQTIPQFQVMRPIEESNKLLLDKIANSENLIIAGSLHSNSVIFKYIDIIIYLKCPTHIRLKRIKQRDIDVGRNSLNSDDAEVRENFLGFLELAKKYNSLGLDKRSRASQKWVISSCNAKVIKIRTNRKVEKVRNNVLKKLKILLK